ncbi:COX15/CtaA family protein [Thauera sp. CAU 1555]|uniref:COX15/CtaA family protein n=1 Tax=Thauera sedimentorum TaxID=2767595 RepID=A0ABR9BD00_9RHOO|nr:COX15/CtaA family protein [Thauera sedimentorum]MBC9073306.1 COX15/CtaA family protein [Thauera sedimentorum]MBD8504225.1 COX15/CtaA family protein [Thauera sedimentorum]
MGLYRRLVLLALLLTAVVVVFGAYVRLADAGLGCPDWPGCYGQLSPAHAADDIRAAHAADPHGPVSLPKAWKEMVHRYLAATLGLVIIAIAVLAWRRRAEPGSAPGVAMVLVGVVIFQGLLGKWTVTLLLKPAIVTAHLLGGLTTLALLSWLALRAYAAPRRQANLAAGASAPLRLAAAAGFVLLVGQIALGGWTSTNYAALACTDFPACHGSYWPEADYANAFHVVRELGMTADGELLSLAALTAIHWTHRLGALVAGGFLLVLGAALMRRPGSRDAGIALLAALAVQVGLGIANVLLSLPLPLAVAHNAGAALLVGVMVWVNFTLACTRSLPFKGRVGVGMGSNQHTDHPIPLPTSPLKGEEQTAALAALSSNPQEA